MRVQGRPRRSLAAVDALPAHCSATRSAGRTTASRWRCSPTSPRRRSGSRRTRTRSSSSSITWTRSRRSGIDEDTTWDTNLELGHPLGPAADRARRGTPRQVAERQDVRGDVRRRGLERRGRRSRSKRGRDATSRSSSSASARSAAARMPAFIGPDGERACAIRGADRSRGSIGRRSRRSPPPAAASTSSSIATAIATSPTPSSTPASAWRRRSACTEEAEELYWQFLVVRGAVPWRGPAVPPRPRPTLASASAGAVAALIGGRIRASCI